MSIDLTCTVAATPGEAWRYFASPGAFRRLSPPFMPLRPVWEAASLRDGLAVLEPRTALPGPLGRRFGPRWHARHDPAGYVEGERFVDRCVSQPYAAATGWVHTHTVTAAPDGAALLGDFGAATIYTAAGAGEGADAAARQLQRGDVLSKSADL